MALLCCMAGRSTVETFRVVMVVVIVGVGSACWAALAPFHVAVGRRSCRLVFFCLGIGLFARPLLFVLLCVCSV